MPALCVGVCVGGCAEGAMLCTVRAVRPPHEDVSQQTLYELWAPRPPVPGLPGAQLLAQALPSLWDDWPLPGREYT